MTGSCSTSDGFAEVAARLQGCRVCRDAPATGSALPHEPRPIVQGSATARLCIASQAPGIRAHRSGRPFQDPSGIRLRRWLDLDEPTFYDPARVAIVPMGHCFPGHDAAGGDLPPRRECAALWRSPVLAALPHLELILVIGMYAQAWHLGPGAPLTETVRRWREILAADRRPRILPLPHPSWRNSGWLKRQPWFEEEVLPVLRKEVAGLMSQPSAPYSRLRGVVESRGGATGGGEAPGVAALARRAHATPCSSSSREKHTRDRRSENPARWR